MTVRLPGSVHWLQCKLHGQATSPSADTALQVLDYITSRLHRGLFSDLSDAEILDIVGDGGGLVVDVVLYLVPRSGMSSTTFARLTNLALTAIHYRAHRHRHRPPSTCQHTHEHHTSSRPSRYSLSRRDLSKPGSHHASIT